jgi:hypothetical protein
MILHGSQRGGTRDLALHLLKDENEHVEVHEIRGFMAQDIKGAFSEIDAISLGTKCKQPMFSLSLNPPAYADVGTPAFERAIDNVEKRLGLDNQPRAIVFHEKEGRRHAHAVWSRIDADKMTAINLPFYKKKLNGLSKELYLEHGWELPKGFKDPLLRDPTNFTLAEWQQAQRAGRDPREIKQVMQTAYKQSDSPKALNAALNEKGFILAKGDRRGFVAVDYTGEVYSLARYAGIKTKDVKERLGTPENLPSVEKVKQQFRDKIKPNLVQQAKDLKQQHKEQVQPLKEEAYYMALYQKQDRQQLQDDQAKREQHAREHRQAKFRGGLGGLFDWVSGKTKQLKEQHEFEAWELAKTHQMQRDNLIYAQLDQRKQLQHKITDLRDKQRQERQQASDTIGKALILEGRKAFNREHVRRAFDKPRDREKGLSLGH